MADTVTPSFVRRKSSRVLNDSSQEPLSLDSLHKQVAAHLGQPSTSFGVDDDLIGLGLDSIGILRLSILWRRSGAEIPFGDLLIKPTLAHWWRLVCECPSARLLSKPLATGAPLHLRSEPFDLTPMQQAYRMGRTDDHLFGCITPHYYFELDGTNVDPDRLQQAVHLAVARHEMMRARFLANGRQEILDVSPSRLKMEDLRHQTAAELETTLQQMRAEFSHMQLAVEEGQVFDIRLSLLPSGRTRIHLNITMLICDARSLQILLTDLCRYYDKPDVRLPPLSFSYARYLAEKASRTKNAQAREQEYWKGRIGQMPGAPGLPFGLAGAPLKASGSAQLTRHICAEDKRSIMKAAARHNVSLAVTLMTAFAMSLGRWTEDPRFLLNIPVFDRDEWDPAIGELVGDFTNLVLLEMDFSDLHSFAEHAVQVRSRLFEHARHLAYPGVSVIRDLSRLHPDHGLVAPVVFTSTIGMGELFDAAFQKFFGKPVWVSSETPQVWIDHQVMESEGGLLLRLEFLEGLFPDHLITTLFESYVGLVTWLGSGNWTDTAPLPLPPRQKEVRDKVNAMQGAPPEGLLHMGFFKHAVAEPDQIALIPVDNSWVTYGDLARDALAVASTLVQANIGPGSVVAVHIPRGRQQIGAVLGVLASGNILLPLSMDQPAARLQTVIEKAGALAILTSESIPRLPEQCRTIRVDEAILAAPLCQPRSLGADATAYVIFTSGSTGMPKGVEIAHRAAVNTIEDINQRYDVNSGFRALAISNCDFDLSIYDIFGLLSVGGSLVLLAEDDRLDARRWLQLVKTHRVNMWNSVPALLDMVLICAEAEATLLPLELVLVSGDWVGLDLCKRLRRFSAACRFISLGGATEASIWSNAFEVSEVDEFWKSVPYGFPLRNQKFRTVDSLGRDCPDWVPGELWIGGAGVAKGYLNDAALTSERFVEWNGDRWYRTGDRGRYWPNGTLEFLGRTDSQVKVRGFRIELREIETVLALFPGVERAVAVIVTEPAQTVAAAIVFRAEPPSLQEFRSFVADRLPAYMVPQKLLAFDIFPVTANGKIDRAAIASKFLERPRVTEDAASTETEEVLATLWGDLLHQVEVGRHDDFFALGGDSLLATRLVETINLRFGIRLRMRDFLISPTVARLAANIDSIAPPLEEGTI